MFNPRVDLIFYVYSEFKQFPTECFSSDAEIKFMLLHSTFLEVINLKSIQF